MWCGLNESSRKESTAKRERDGKENGVKRIKDRWGVAVWGEKGRKKQREKIPIKWFSHNCSYL